VDRSEGCQRLCMWQIKEAEYPKFLPLLAAPDIVVHLELPEAITVLHINADA